MHKHDHIIKPEYQQVVMRVLHYINQNLIGDVSLKTLAKVANYSPFHFQKLFSEAVSESPKQYVIRLRLERAAHYLKVFPNLPVFEIGTGCGFSSPSVFSRAFKNYYGVSAEVFKELSADDISSISKQNTKNNNPFIMENSDVWISQLNNVKEDISVEFSSPPVIVKLKSLKIACIQTTMNHPESITFSFKSLMKWAIPHDLATSGIKSIGIWLDMPVFTSPDKCRYLTGIELKNETKIKKDVELVVLKEGKYACISMKGNLKSTFEQIVANIRST